MKKLTCIECPKGCLINISTKNGKITRIKGNSCPKGKAYAKQEVENPVRVLTSSVLAQGLAFKMIPVKTDKPVPKSRMLDVMERIRKVKVKKPVKLGDVIVRNILGLKTNLIATRSVYE